MNILVTGGSGFIGSNLCDYLVLNDCNVSVIDDLSSGDISNLSSVINSINFYHEKLELFDFGKMSKFDVVVHLSAQPSVPLSIENFGSSSSSNLLGTIKIIDYCRVNLIPLVYASSSAIYGDLELGNDLNNKVDLLSPYGADKYVMELYSKIAFQLYELSSVGLRFFNVYGPRQDPSSDYSGVISIFIDRLMREDNIIIKGGFQTRDFIYVNDVVKQIFNSIKLVRGNKICECLNVLTGQSISIDDLADILINELNVDVEKKYQKLPNGDPEKSSGTTEKMVRLLNTDLIDMMPIKIGLSETIKYIRNQK